MLRGQIMKRTIAFFLAMILMTASLTLHVSAEDVPPGSGQDSGGTYTLSHKGIIQEGSLEIPDGEYTVSEELTDMVVSSVKGLERKIDLTEYAIPATEIDYVVSMILNYHPELYEVTFDTCELEDGFVTILYARYAAGAYSRISRDQEIEYAVQEALDVVSPSMSNEEKILAIHDYMAYTIDYSYEALEDPNLTAFDDVFNVYGALVNKSCVCQGYALAFGLLMNRLGIDWRLATSVSMNHAWNLVNLEGQWYHMDVTWDASTSYSQLFGFRRPLHNFVLLSDSTISDADHQHSDWKIGLYGTEPMVYASSENYKNAEWKDSDTRWWYRTGSWYYIKDDSIYRKTISGKPEMLLSLDTYGSLACNLFVDGDYIYYNTEEALYCLDLNTNVSTEILSVKPEANVKICSSGLKNKKFCIIIGEDPYAYEGWIVPVSVRTSFRVFYDIDENDWYKQYADYVNANGLMTGLKDFIFGGNEMLSRAQFATIVYRMEGKPEVTYESRFPDVPQGTFYTDAVIWCSQNGILAGYENGNFGPADHITREQMATILYRFVKQAGADVSGQQSLNEFPDARKVSAFAKEALQWAAAERIISGNGTDHTLNPQGNTSRAECAAVLTRFLERYTAQTYKRGTGTQEEPDQGIDIMNGVNLFYD